MGHGPVEEVSRTKHVFVSGQGERFEEQKHVTLMCLAMQGYVRIIKLHGTEY